VTTLLAAVRKGDTEPSLIFHACVIYKDKDLITASFHLEIHSVFSNQFSVVHKIKSKHVLFCFPCSLLPSLFLELTHTNQNIAAEATKCVIIPEIEFFNSLAHDTILY